MREIKFRAWYPDWKRMEYFTLEDAEKMYFVDCVIMQFTGLHDRNGKEIYEGDIVRWQAKKGRVFQGFNLLNDPASLLYGVKPGEVDEDTTYIDVVEFHAGCYFLVCPCTKGGAFLARENANSEVIGNIYENPELIKGGV